MNNYRENRKSMKQDIHFQFLCRSNIASFRKLTTEKTEFKIFSQICVYDQSTIEAKFMRLMIEHPKEKLKIPEKRLKQNRFLTNRTPKAYEFEIGFRMYSNHFPLSRGKY